MRGPGVVCVVMFTGATSTACQSVYGIFASKDAAFVVVIGVSNRAQRMSMLFCPLNCLLLVVFQILTATSSTPRCLLHYISKIL